MRKIIFIFVYFLCAQTVNAEQLNCRQRLTANHLRDSSVYRLNTLDLDVPNFGNDELALATFYVKALILNEGCSRSEINFAKGPWGRSRSICKRLIPQAISSKICYLETNLGYFTVNSDLLDHILITFSRWD